MTCLITSQGRQYIFASMNLSDNHPRWIFSLKRFILSETDHVNPHQPPSLMGQFISSGWFSQIIEKNHNKDYLLMVIEFTGDFSYVENNQGYLIPSLVTEIEEVMSGCENPHLNSIENFIIDNCHRVTDAFLFDFGENLYSEVFALENDGDERKIKMTCPKNYKTMNLSINIRKMIENDKHSLYISHPEFKLTH